MSSIHYYQRFRPLVLYPLYLNNSVIEDKTFDQNFPKIVEFQNVIIFSSFRNAEIENFIESLMCIKHSSLDYLPFTRSGFKKSLTIKRSNITQGLSIKDVL